MSKILIKHHGGMGDAIVHNGLVRKISEDNPKSEIYLLSHKWYLENYQFMYRDNKLINILPLADSTTSEFINSKPFEKTIDLVLSNCKFSYDIYQDDAFYLCAGLSPSIKKTHFYLQRDFEQENFIYNKIINDIGTDEFIFVHEKPELGIRLDRGRINDKLPIVYASPEYKIFDLLTTIERSKEVHVLSSCFLSLFTIQKMNENTFAHMYVYRREFSDYISKSGINVLL